MTLKTRNKTCQNFRLQIRPRKKTILRWNPKLCYVKSLHNRNKTWKSKQVYRSENKAIFYNNRAVTVTELIPQKNGQRRKTTAFNCGQPDKKKNTLSQATYATVDQLLKKVSLDACGITIDDDASDECFRMSSQVTSVASWRCIPDRRTDRAHKIQYRSKRKIPCRHTGRK